MKIKSPNSKDQRRKHKLLEILSKNAIYAAKTITVTDGFVVLTRSESEQDRIFSNKTDNELKKNFVPQISLELKAKRSVFTFEVENDMFSNEEDIIKDEIEQQNYWVGQIQQMQKFPSKIIIKLTFDETSKAEAVYTKLFC